MLFINHDQAQGLELRKYRGARANDHPGAPEACILPGLESLGVTQARMHRHHLLGEALLKARDGLWCQANFRHQYHGLVTALERGGDGIEVDLGFAAAGYALQQEALELAQALGVGSRYEGQGLVR